MMDIAILLTLILLLLIVTLIFILYIRNMVPRGVPHAGMGISRYTGVKKSLKKALGKKNISITPKKDFTGNRDDVYVVDDENNYLLKDVLKEVIFSQVHKQAKGNTFIVEITDESFKHSSPTNFDELIKSLEYTNLDTGVDFVSFFVESFSLNMWLLPVTFFQAATAVLRYKKTSQLLSTVCDNITELKEAVMKLDYYVRIERFINKLSVYMIRIKNLYDCIDGTTNKFNDLFLKIKLYDDIENFCIEFDLFVVPLIERYFTDGFDGINYERIRTKASQEAFVEVDTYLSKIDLFFKIRFNSLLLRYLNACILLVCNQGLVENINILRMVLADVEEIMDTLHRHKDKLVDLAQKFQYDVIKKYLLGIELKFLCIDTKEYGDDELRDKILARIDAIFSRYDSDLRLIDDSITQIVGRYDKLKTSKYLEVSV